MKVFYKNPTFNKMYFLSKYFFQEEFGGKPLDLSELSNVSTSCPSITQKRMKE